MCKKISDVNFICLLYISIHRQISLNSIFMYEPDLPLDNLQCLVCYINKPNPTMNIQ